MFEAWTGVGSFLGTAMFLWTMLRPYFPRQLEQWMNIQTRRFWKGASPYVSVVIEEYDDVEHFRPRKSAVYIEVKAYLSGKSSQMARTLKVEAPKEGDNLLVTVGDDEEVIDQFMGIKVWWYSSNHPRRTQPTLSLFSPTVENDRRFYRLVFHQKDREKVIDSYLPHVRKEGRSVIVGNRQRKLFTNISSERWDYGHHRSMWSHVVFEHPSTFETLAMDPAKKKEIMDDLTTFMKAKEYYAAIGKPWKRGYLLCGPPGTGKSTMIAAMANYLGYDVYDLELTAVRSNTDLRKMFIETTSKSIIVIEDVDCSIELTGSRENNKKREKSKKTADEEKVIEEVEKVVDPVQREKDENKVTLSGLLNFIDGLWSACGGERIIVFTTNHVDKLDPALIRTGRMDMRIDMSYCRFEAFKTLAHNYLSISHHAHFDTIAGLLEEVDMSPADVAEILMRKSVDDDEDARLTKLIQALNKHKDEKEKNSGDQIIAA